MNTPNVNPLAMSPELQELVAPSPMNTFPSYQQGGLTTPQGPSMGVGQAQPMDSRMLEMKINQFATQNPQALAQIRQAVMQAMQSGELSPQELNMMVQLATVAAQNPQMYPQIRQFAIQQGLATEQDLPQQYDQGLVIALLIAAKAAQQTMGGAPAGAPPPAEAGPLPSFYGGGPTGNRAPKDGFLGILHPREYVADETTLMYHGKKTFDAMRDKAWDDKLGITKGTAKKA